MNMPVTSAEDHRSRGQKPSSSSLGSFTARLLVVILVGSLAAALWQLSEIVMLLFGASLLAIGLCAAAKQVSALTGIRKTYALSGVIVIGMAAFGSALWLFGSLVSAQISDVLEEVPAGFKLSMDWLKANSYGRLILDQARGINVLGATGWATSMATAAMGWITRGVGYAILTLFVAVYLAAQPDLYRHLCLRLVPPARRPAVGHLFDAVGDVLRRWLIGQLMVMGTVGILTGIGLYCLGINAAVALGLLGGLFCFIPYVGAILAAIPATLVALTQGPLSAASVVLMYAGVHFLEGNFITPFIQAKATELPPVLAILSTVAFSLLFGASGVLLAAPLTLFLITVVELLYVQAGLGEEPEDSPAEKPE